MSAADWKEGSMSQDEEHELGVAPDDDMEIEEDDADVVPRVEGGVAETETVEALVFVTNPDYPYPFKVEKPPRFWMDEQTGALEDAVATYMDGDRLNAGQ